MTGSEGRNRKTAIRRAMDLLARRDRFIGELRSDLAKSGFEPAEIDEAVESLSERRLLDDPALAARRVRDWRRAGRSNADCIARLRSKGASRSVAEAAVHGTADGPEDESDPELEAA
ncbi:MAG: RecX family transcriptional regulator, partial [Planctomycetota bacterium]|nr:RecX family transcriptional regulator [Planctomycetota bacterium]